VQRGPHHHAQVTRSARPFYTLNFFAARCRSQHQMSDSSEESRAGLGLQNAGSGFTLRVRAFCGPGCLFSKIGLGLLVYLVKARAQAHSAGSGLGPLRP
jgi:hypothetical protein